MATSSIVVEHADFLGGERRPMLDFALDQEANFRAATVSIGAGNRVVIEGVRRARILHQLGDFEAPFVARLRELLQPALQQLAHQEFPIGRIEAQITASNDGDYFRLHQDGGPDDTRVISFVYFLHSEPRRFTGGELRVLTKTVLPQGDTLIFFPSLSPHEVLPLSVPTRAFADSRFTVNGWIHRMKNSEPGRSPAAG
jgi:predicted 2-oxoglutarate/Fe(II)-dependent dioxygenase YbiX